MNNPYGHTGYTDSEEVAREKTLAAISWQQEMIRKEQRVVLGAMRRRSIRKLTQIGVGAVLLGGALFIIVRYMYLNYFWN